MDIRFTGWSSENLTLELSGNSYGFVNVTDSDVLTASFEEIFEVYVPNSFTPNNGDYDNNKFKISVFTEKEFLFTIKIYNKWGQFISESKDIDNAWDGTNQKQDRRCQMEYIVIYNITLPESVYEKKEQ